MWTQSYRIPINFVKEISLVEVKNLLKFDAIFVSHMIIDNNHEVIAIDGYIVIGNW